jgi:hypothetical protein|tara:strand:- start:415 stop:618 length:204 start_codon:yes stop_codon:yes gene_type:complete
MFSKQCKAHLDTVGETGLKHMVTALTTAVKLQLLVPALIIHSIAPRCFTDTASNVMKNILYKRHRTE